MKTEHPFLVATILLAVVLLVSIVLNYLLYERGRQYYLALSAARLDPLGLNYYSTAADQMELTNSELTTVVFFGDSRAANWPSPDLEGFEFINRGIGAQTSEQAAGRFRHHVKPLQSQLIVVQVGINDLKTIPLFPERKESIIRNCEENIQQIVRWSIDMGAKVVLTTIFPIGEAPMEREPFWSNDVALAVDEVNEYIHSLEGEAVVIFDAYAILVGEGGAIEPEYSQDILHLNATGYERLNSELVKTLKGLK
ncbi:MAG: SGNH/GDSL hydrolase family protein [Anaerolineae bacterium]|nr:SGNH/GDSL hydrolase family protein [Anaerolineae bacterium]